MKERALALLLALPVLLASSTAAADPGGDFQPYKPGAATEQVSAPLHVVLAYSLIWLVLLGFVASVWRRQRRVEAEIREMRRQLERTVR
jgi:CcmD family protein